MTTAELHQRLVTALPGPWEEVRFGYRRSFPGGAIEVTMPGDSYIVRVEEGRESTQLTGLEVGLPA